MSDNPRNPFIGLSAFAASGDLHVIIDTPKGSRNKFKYDPELGLFKLKHVLPAGAVFPFDFGYVPSTQGKDGDPLDVLLLMDEPAFVGCLVLSRLIGVIEADQTEAKETTGNNSGRGAAWVRSAPSSWSKQAKDIFTRANARRTHHTCSPESQGRPSEDANRISPTRPRAPCFVDPPNPVALRY